jgi:hypothetical protein
VGEGFQNCTNSDHLPHYNSKLLDTKALLEQAQSGIWSGKADSLRAYHLYKWPIIDEVAIAASKPQTKEPEWQTVRQHTIKSSGTKTATAIIRQRRSAQQFDGKMSSLPQTDFFPDAGCRVTSNSGVRTLALAAQNSPVYFCPSR